MLGKPGIQIVCGRNISTAEMPLRQCNCSENNEHSLKKHPQFVYQTIKPNGPQETGIPTFTSSLPLRNLKMGEENAESLGQPEGRLFSRKSICNLSTHLGGGWSHNNEGQPAPDTSHSAMHNSGPLFKPLLQGLT